MGKPFIDERWRRAYEVFHRYFKGHACDEDAWECNNELYELAHEFGLPISPEVAHNAIDGPDPDPESDSDDARSEGAPTPRYHPADLYTDEPSELLLLATLDDGNAMPLPEE